MYRCMLSSIIWSYVDLALVNLSLIVRRSAFEERVSRRRERANAGDSLCFWLYFSMSLTTFGRNAMLC